MCYTDISAVVEGREMYEITVNLVCDPHTLLCMKVYTSNIVDLQHKQYVLIIVIINKQKMRNVLRLEYPNSLHW